MPLEVKINFNRGVIKLPNIKPGTNAIVPDYVSDEIIVISCNEGDDGGTIGKTDIENIEHHQTMGTVVRIEEGLRQIQDIGHDKTHRDYIGLVPTIPLIIGELVIQHS